MPPAIPAFEAFRSLSARLAAMSATVARLLEYSSGGDEPSPSRGVRCVTIARRLCFLVECRIWPEAGRYEGESGMSVWRYLLLAVNAALFIGGIVLLRMTIRHTSYWDWGPVLAFSGLIVLALFNALYVARTAIARSRLGRLFGLWLDATENDLKIRASRKQTD
jgi:hypothetical protein